MIPGRESNVAFPNRGLIWLQILRCVWTPLPWIIIPNYGSMLSGGDTKLTQLCRILAWVNPVENTLDFCSIYPIMSPEVEILRSDTGERKSSFDDDFLKQCVTRHQTDLSPWYIKGLLLEFPDRNILMTGCSCCMVSEYFISFLGICLGWWKRDGNYHSWENNCKQPNICHKMFYLTKIRSFSISRTAI